YNSGVYCNSRMLYGLAEQGDAPRLFLRLNRRGVPVMGILISGLITLLCVALNYVLPEGALIILMSLVVAALVLNWAMISLSHLMFRRSMQQQGVTPTFRALWSPLGNWLCLAFVGFILVVLLLDSSTRLSVFVLPVWVAVIGICYLLKRRAACTTADELVLVPRGGFLAPRQPGFPSARQLPGNVENQPAAPSRPSLHGRAGARPSRAVQGPSISLD